MTALLGTLLGLAAIAHADAGLPPLVISATRWPESPKRTSRSVAVVDRASLERRAQRSVAESVREEPGILVQQTMPANAAISVRGLAGKDNLVLVDGVRLNNAITANINSLSLIDPETVEAVEILRGPGSVLYGGDALGGVVYVVPRRRADYSRPCALGGALSATHRTADHGRIGRFELEGNRGSFGFLAGVGAKAFGDLDVGGNQGPAVPSSYRGRSGDVALDWRGDKSVLRATFQHALQLEAPRYEQYPGARRFGGPGRFDEFVFDPQKRDLLVLEAKADELAGLVRSFEAKGYWHRQEEGNNQRRAGSATRNVFNDVVVTAGGRLEAVSQPLERLRMVYGAEAYRDSVRSRRRDVDLVTGASVNNDADANYPDGSTYGSAGLFLLGQAGATERLVLESGLRFDHAWVDSTLRAGAAPGAFSDAYRSVTGGAGATYSATTALQFSASVWQGFRPPNFNESVALKTAPAGTDAPAPGLLPEKSLGFELGARHSAGSFGQRVTLFHMLLRDRIERVRGSFNGLTTIAGSPVFQRANSGSGYLQGVEWEGRAGLWSSTYLRANGSWLYGRDTSAGTAMTRIPPPAALVALGREWKENRGWLETYARLAAAQRRLSPADLADPRIDPNGTPAWATWNLRGGLELFANTRFQLAVENVLDALYREHASGIEAPGINVIWTLRVAF